MPFFFNRYIVKEADIDGNPQEGNPNTTDYTEEQDDAANTSTPEDAANNQDQDDNTQNNNSPSAEGEDNQPQDVSDAGDDGNYTDYTQEDYGDDQSQDGYEGGSEAEDEAPVDDIKRQEEEMYANISTDQLDIMHRELKNRFIDLYNLCINTIERMSSIHVGEENISTLEYISKTLSTVKDMIVDYIHNIYKSKSYIENNINYNKYLVILNGVCKMLETIESEDK